jgi:hypothetical protein
MARIAGFKPGTSPPPVRIAIVPLPPTMRSPHAVPMPIPASLRILQSWKV